jgi:ATP-dependent Zn protease
VVSNILNPTITRESLINQVATLVSGQRALILMGNPHATLEPAKLKQARELISRFILEGHHQGGGLEIGQILYREGKPHLTSNQAQLALKLMQEYFTEGERQADQILKQNWSLLRDLTAQLIRNGTLTGSDFYQQVKLSGRGLEFTTKSSKLSCSKLYAD